LIKDVLYLLKQCKHCSTTEKFQWRERQVNLSFTYRFNKKKNDRERTRGEGREEGEFIGG
jgi:hypothetical protein